MSETIDETTIHDEVPTRRLVRTSEGRWLGGVAAGLGRYFDVNPIVYRIAFAALLLAGGTGLLLYLAAYLVIPDESADESIAVEALRGHRERPWFLLGVGLLAFGALFALSEAPVWPDTGNVWLAAMIVGGALVWWHVSNRDRPARSEKETATAETATAETATTETATAETAPRAQPAPPAPRPPKKPSLLAPAIGVILAVSGVFGLLTVLDIYDVDLDVALAAGVAIIGGAIAVGALTQRRVGGLVVLGLLLLAVFGVAALTPVSVSSGVGEKVERPLTADAVEPSYELGVGELDLDLGDIALRSGTTTTVDASVGIGSLVITVPEGVALEIDAEAGIGEVDIFGSTDDGVDAHRSLSEPGPTPDAPVLEIEADVGFGGVEVVRG